MRPGSSHAASARVLVVRVAAASAALGLWLAPVQMASARPPSRILEKTVGGKISGEVRLSGRVRVTDDLLVLPGATLVLARGTVVTFEKSESSKVEPEVFFGGTELVVRGGLRAEGTEFRFAERSGGIVVDGGRAEFADCLILGAEAGLSVIRDGTVRVSGPLGIRDCRVGIALFPSARGGVEGDGAVTLSGNGVGAVRFPGSPGIPPSVRAGKSEEADRIGWDGPSALSPSAPEPPEAPPAAGALRLGDAFVERDRTLSGDVVVDGIVRVAPGATLTILPGSRIFFSFRDTDGDGIGENGLFLQGTLLARGTPGRPIRFLPEEPGGRGRWDSINFMASDQGENRIEHAVVSGAYRGLHAHFSRLKGAAIRISDSFRGVQFQESDVDLSDVEIVSALSALRCRDSNVRLERFRVRGAASGGNFLRSNVTLLAPDVAASWYGLRFRESRVEVRGGSAKEGLVGVSVQEGTVALDGFAAESAGLAGFALQEGDVTLTKCRVSGSRLDAASAVRARVVMTGGSLSGFGRHAVKLGGPAEVLLRGVDLGPAAAGMRPILDGKAAPGLGIVTVE